MDGLRVSVWKKFGQDRLYVNTRQGETAAWMDRRTGHVEIVMQALGDAARTALAAYQAKGPQASPIAPVRSVVAQVAQVGSALPPVPPEYDLALNKPGDSLRSLVETPPPGLVTRFLAWLLRRPVKTDSWSLGIAGEEVVGAELARLSRHGWYALHSIPLPRIKADIDHLLIGPGGVFTVNTKNHRGRKVWVGDHVARVDRGKSWPYVRTARREASRVAHVLTGACGFPVAVSGILAFVAPADLRVEPTLLDVRALKDRELSALAPLSGALTTAQVERVYRIARDRRVWEHAK